MTELGPKPFSQEATKVAKIRNHLELEDRVALEKIVKKSGYLNDRKKEQDLEKYRSVAPEDLRKEASYHEESIAKMYSRDSFSQSVLKIVNYHRSFFFALHYLADSIEYHPPQTEASEIVSKARQIYSQAEDESQNYEEGLREKLVHNPFKIADHPSRVLGESERIGVRLGEIVAIHKQIGITYEPDKLASAARNRKSVFRENRYKALDLHLRAVIESNDENLKEKLEQMFQRCSEDANQARDEFVILKAATDNL